VGDFKGKDEPCKRPVSRRTFFGLLIGAAAAIGGIMSLDFILPKEAEPETSRSTTVASPTVTETTSNTSTVSISEPNVVRVVVVKGTASVDRQVLVDKALEALGGVEKLVPTGTNILVKPNVGFYETDATTDPRITAAVVETLKRARPSQIVVGESALRGIDVDYALQITGTRSLAEAAGAEVRDLRKDTVVTVEVPNGLAIKSVNVFRTARDSFIVSVPRLKRHSATTVTISLKNMIGAAPDDEKGRFHQVNLNQCIADLNMALRPRLAIIDATEAMTRSGPSGGVMVELNLVLASTDPVAADLVAAEELFKAEGIADPSGAAASIEHIQNAARLGVGTADPSRIEVMNVSVG
jgi:uncharacterized protein (DUF362 family)